jgi:hypothetical protein
VPLLFDSESSPGRAANLLYRMTTSSQCVPALAFVPVSEKLMESST